MRDLLRHWPPLAWLGVATGSLFVSMGMQRFDLLSVGLCLILLSFTVAVYLAVRPEPGAAPPRGFGWVLGGIGVFYAVCALAAAAVGLDYALVALLAGAIPATAVTLVYATARRKTRVEGGRLQDASREDLSPFPGIGFDDDRPVGDTPEAHDELVPEDLPRDHPGRRAAEQQAQSTGTTRGHREGGAADERDPASTKVLGDEERHGSRFRR